MPPLQTIFPNLPTTLPTIMLTVAGLLGAITLSYAVLLEKEKNQDAVLVLASASLLVYSLLEGSFIFILASTLLFLVSGRELVLILLGRHHHTKKEINDYETPGKK